MPGQFITDVRAVLFDLDGTLLDTLEDIGRSANETLEELGFPPHPIESYRQFIGDGLVMLFRRALPAGLERGDEALPRNSRAAGRPRDPITRHGRALEQAPRVHRTMRQRIAAALALPGDSRRS